MIIRQRELASIRRLFPGKPEQNAEKRGYASDHSLAFSPDGRWLAVTAAGNAIELWNVPEARLSARSRGARGQLTAASFSPDGRGILSAGRDGTIRLWQPATAVCSRC